MHALRKINSVYYVRARLPRHLNFDKAEVCFSLRTRDKGRAAIAATIFRSLLARPLIPNSDWLKEATLKLFRAVERQLETSLSKELIPSLVSAAYPDDLLSTAFERTEIEVSHLKLAVDERCPDFLRENNVNFEPDSSELELLKQKVLGIEFAMNKFAGARRAGDIESQMKYQESLATFEAQKATAPPITFKQVQLPKLTEMMDTFFDEWRNPDDGKPCSEDRKNKFIQTFNELIFFVGNKPVNLYTEQEIQLLFDYFAKTPKSRKKHHSRKSIQELLDLNATGDKLQSYANKVKHRQRLRQFFEWVIEQAEISNDELAKSLELVNPCDNTRIRKDGKATKRTYFTKLDEQELFNRKLFLQRSVKDGLPIVREDHQYWGSLILRCTGARPNELFQSELRNWQFDPTIKTWVLWTSNSGDDQHIKNDGSIRPVPMPTLVMDKGFDNFIRNKKAKLKETTKLFDKITPTGGYYSPAYTNWFNNVLMVEAKIDKRDQLGRKKSAYSLRHTFVTRARKDGARFDVVKQNVGHSVKQELGVTSNYFGGYEVDELHHLLSHLTFPELEELPTYNEWKSNLIGEPPD